MESKDSRYRITENWLKAIKYLIDVGKIGSFRDFEAVTGIHNQRISMIKTYIQDPEHSKPSFAHVDYVYELVKNFNVSLDFIFFDKLPILVDDKPKNYPDIKESVATAEDTSKEYSNQLFYVIKKIGSIEDEIKDLREMTMNKK